MSTIAKSNVLSAAGTGTDWLTINPGKFSVSVQGGFVGRVSLQRSFDGGVTAETVTQYEDQGADTLDAAEPMMVRLFILPGDWQSGQASCRLGQYAR
jgi:hypothetical protein